MLVVLVLLGSSGLAGVAVGAAGSMAWVCVAVEYITTVWHVVARFRSRALPIAVVLVRADDELAEELAAKTIKVVTVKFGGLLALEVGLCEWH